MRKNLFFICIMCLISGLNGCYDDQGGNDFDTILPDVQITFPELTYSASIGSTITVIPTITTDIPQEDLEYFWEVLGDGDAAYNDQERNVFKKFGEGKVLEFTCALNELMTTLNTTYTCRLHIRQTSTGRDFYSSDHFSINIAGVTGLLVLHGDDSASDVGMVIAQEFVPAATQLPASPSAISKMYSTANGGNKLNGKGKYIVQSVVGDANYAPERCRIYIQTEQEAVWADMNDLSLYGDWNKRFYLQDDRKINAGIPKGFCVGGYEVFAFDGDEVYATEQSFQDLFLFPIVKAGEICGDSHSYTLAPVVQDITGGSFRRVFYAESVDGNKTWKGFVGHSNGGISSFANYMKLFDTKNDVVVYNPGNMQADLIIMRYDNRNHVMAILKGDVQHTTYANKYFIADFYPNATVDATQETGLANSAQCLYDLSGLENIDNVFAFELGETQNMAYYATPTTVYHYTLSGNGNIGIAEKLCMEDGSVLNIDGEITMMKILNSPNISTHNNEPILVLATWNENKSILYALHLDIMTGNVTYVAKYDSNTVSDWEFNRIYDVNIKGL